MSMKLEEFARESRATHKGDKSGVPIVGLEHLIPQEIKFSGYDVDTENTFTKTFKKGQILFGRRRAYLKKAAIADFDGICSGDITVIEAIPGKVDPLLLPFIIQNDKFFDYAVSRSAGGLSPRVKWEHLKDYEFDLPPIEEQRILADKLWAAYRLKESYKKLLTATQEMVKLQKEFDELTDQISEEDKNELVRRTSVDAFFTAEKRINDVCKYIVSHFREYVEPTGMKAQVVVYNRECCVKYKKALDALLGTDDQTTIIMHTAGDKADEYKAYKRSRDEEKKLLDQFRDPLSPLKFVIVTSKLLTGFDAPILQCMYLDKPMKNHTLLQAICRTNRTYNENKKCGLIVDFVGVFEDVAKSLAFDEETVKTIVQNIDEIKSLIPTFMQQCIEFFPGVDRTIGGWEGLTAAQQCLKDDGVKTNFGRHFARLNKAWEIVSPDACLAEYQNDYTWLAQVYQSVRPVSGGNLIWTLLGAKTIEIIHRNIETIDIGTPLEDLVVDADVIDAVLEDEKAREKKIVEVEKILRLRLGEHKGDPNFKKFAEKLDELRERMEQNLISSIDFLKQLLALAKDLLEEEKKKDEPQDKRAQARAALTDLFQSIKTEDTPIIVEQVVNDIDNEVVNIVRQFNDAFQSVTARREIKKKLRAILWVKYQIKDNDVFERAYQYIEMYY